MQNAIEFNASPDVRSNAAASGVKIIQGKGVELDPASPEAVLARALASGKVNMGDNGVKVFMSDDPSLS